MQALLLLLDKLNCLTRGRCLRVMFIPGLCNSIASSDSHVQLISVSLQAIGFCL